MSEHTPGPWSIIPYDDSDGATIISEPIDGHIHVIAELPRSRGNAKLISAAPALLAACEAVYNMSDVSGISGPAFAQVMNAIQKARGE